MKITYYHILIVFLCVFLIVFLVKMQIMFNHITIEIYYVYIYIFFYRCFNPVDFWKQDTLINKHCKSIYYLKMSRGVNNMVHPQLDRFETLVFSSNSHHFFLGASWDARWVELLSRGKCQSKKSTGKVKFTCLV